MKKKIWIVVVCVVILLAILFVPIPSGTYKDGGTKEYTSLTYKIVKWNRLMDDDIYRKTSVFFLPNNFKCIDDLWNMEVNNNDINDVYIVDSVEDNDENVDNMKDVSFEAVILEINGDSVLVSPIEKDKERSSSDKISFCISSLEDIGAEVGSVIEITYDGTIMESYPAQINAKDWKLSSSSALASKNEYTEYTELPPAEKPVIYLYPESELNVDVNLQLDGRLTCTYPAYNHGWNVTASPDGTLTDANGQIYNYLYWEGVTSAQYDLSTGFCVRGEDTAAFLENALERLGLNRREANEFIIYWLPRMEVNPYNIISFQTDIYTDAAKLEVSPTPDTMIRVFMVWQASDIYVNLPEQNLSSPERTGFTVIEWGGTEIE